MQEVPESEVRRVVREAVERALGPEKPGDSRPASAPKSPAPARPLPSDERRVAVGADHGGYELKGVISRLLAEELGYRVQDCGTHSRDAVDYPDLAAAVGREVASGRCAFGVVVDAAGIGSTMAANKVPGVRCALCHDDATVLNARRHNDANVLALGANVVHRGAAARMVRLFLTTPFEGGRHERRIRKIMDLERSSSRG